jgi:hypothetical protein
MDEAFLRRVRTAQQEYVGASLELWNVRAQHLKESGRHVDLLALMLDPVTSGADNCECNRGCNVPCGSNCAAIGGWIEAVNEL